MVELLALQTFVRIADGGSLSAAARATGRSLPAVSRSLVQLEAELGVRLLHRTTRRIHLTDAGAQYLERCRRILAEVDEASASVSDLGRALAGPITVTAPVLFGQLHIAPAVTEFLAAHPGVTVSLLLSDALSNIVEEGIDLAVRIGRLHDSGLVARKLGEVRRLACASPAYLRRCGTPKTPKDLTNHNCLQFGALSPTPYWEFHEGGKPRQVRVQGNFSSNQGAPVIEAARGGLGIIFVLSYQVQELIANGGLRVLLQQYQAPPIPVSVILPSGRLQPARVKALADFLQARVAAKSLTTLRASTRSKNPPLGGDGDPPHPLPRPGRHE
jgi:DNA-binding transcriptional LysR family regulator